MGQTKGETVFTEKKTANNRAATLANMGVLISRNLFNP
jgi:hypothetical protein